MPLVTENLEINAGAHILLRDFSLRVSAGEAVSILGPSGAGKTTLLEALAFLRSVGPGRILLDGESPRALGVPSYRRRVMYVSSRPVLPNETVRDVLQRPFAYSCNPRRFDDGAARELLSELGVEPGLTARVQTLSAGEAQRIGLARALLLEPKFCLLDEPTSALDPEHRGRAHRLLRDRIERTTLGIVLVSHDQEEREALGARPVSPNWIREPCEGVIDPDP